MGRCCWEVANLRGDDAGKTEQFSRIRLDRERLVKSSARPDEIAATISLEGRLQDVRRL